MTEKTSFEAVVEARKDAKKSLGTLADAVKMRRDEHRDNEAVDRFAAAMKAKLAKKRAEGRGGWQKKTECSQSELSRMLFEHVMKGDPVDIGNLAMMLHQRDENVDRTVFGDTSISASYYSALVNSLRSKPQRGQDVFELMALYERQRTDAADALTVQYEHLADERKQVQEWQRHSLQLANAIGNVLIKSGIHREGSGGLNGPDMLAACVKLGDLVDTLQRTDTGEDSRTLALHKHAMRWDKLRELFGLDGWYDGVYHGPGTPDQIVTHIEHVANERARLLVLSTKQEAELKEWRENALELLKDDTDVVRMHEGNGPESLVGSLAITMLKTRKQRDEWIRKGREALDEVVRLQNLVAAKNLILKQGVRILSETADLCDRWADESQTGGWSTHQVKANIEAANTCRRAAAALVSNAT